MLGVVHLGLIAIVVSEYDPAIRFFVDGLGFELVEDSPALTNDGRPKRWVVVRPPGAATGVLLVRADGDAQAAITGKQAAGRVGFFLHVEDFGTAYARMASAGGSSSPRRAPNPTATSLCSPTLPAINRTSSAPRHKTPSSHLQEGWKSQECRTESRRAKAAAGPPGPGDALSCPISRVGRRVMYPRRRWCSLDKNLYE
jgi:catechol 2,3-dioxygenase-like lactoylglutathione lyase family enzyme